MPRKKRSEAPAGTLADGELQRWLEHAGVGLGASGIKASFGQAPRAGGAPGATWVSMTSATAHGRLVRSPGGATTLTARALPAGDRLLDERHPHTTLAQLEALVAALGGTRPAPAGRA
ncbi:MAG: hypothetical protein ABIS47_04515 [Acidimicrobiales bacterium]